MGDRRHIPIGTLWSMRIDVPYSLILRQGDFAWSCGQVPLDVEARVIEPDNPAGQARLVAGYTEQILSRVGFGRSAVAKLVVYHLGGDDTRQAIEAALRESLGAGPLICSVAVPHFYYQGLTLEVDVFAYGPGPRAGEQEPADGIELRQAQCGAITYVLIRSELGDAKAAADELEAHNLRPERLLSDHWSLTPESDALTRLSERGLMSDPGAAVCTTQGRGSGELTFASSAVISSRNRSDGLTVIARHSEPFLWIGGRAESGNLLDQTRRIMRGLEAALAGHGFAFADVVKSTTHYVAGSSEDELHANMEIRNACYAKPGPASTGVPVARLREPSSLIAVDILAVRRSG